MPWAKYTSVTATAPNPTCTETVRLLKLYDNDIKGCKFHVNVASDAPENIPGSQWEQIFKGEPIDLDQVLSSLHRRGLVCAPRFPSGISRNRSDSDQNPIGNSGTQDHPNSREFVQFVRPDSDRKGRFRSDHSEPSPTNFRPISDRNQLVPTGSDRKNSQNSDKSLILIDHLT